MSLQHPWFLLLLLLVPGLVWWRHGRARRPTLQFSDGRALGRLPVSWAVRARWALPVLYALALFCLVVALARPRRGLAESRVRTEGVDIVLLSDVSTSMRAEDLSTATRTMNRLDAAKAVMEAFIQARPDDRIGIVAFAAMPYTLAPLTLDHGWLVQQMGRLETGMVEDGTAIGDAIAAAINRLRDSKARSKVVVLLTDGMNNRGVLSPENAAEAARAMGIKVYTVGAGGDEPAPVPISSPFGGRQYAFQPSDIDEPMLKYVAETTGGLYFRARNFKGLDDVYRQIDEMEKTEVDVEHYTRFEERFMPWVIAALVLLGLERLLGLARLEAAP
ncbi:MAG TPA: VWA domain-containing protein [Kiritimatiellia bacterium]|nr:VWA domain-containing protein [Kiritimatiellia bacterium]HRZ10994.1 VWA domain-containing protein [Kiritimatiellia bacterium]HSA18567.1 VWA domain-containing protein [Kiritimatiellia bacterium]